MFPKEPRFVCGAAGTAKGFSDCALGCWNMAMFYAVAPSMFCMTDWHWG